MPPLIACLLLLGTAALSGNSKSTDDLESPGIVPSQGHRRGMNMYTAVVYSRGDLHWRFKTYRVASKDWQVAGLQAGAPLRRLRIASTAIIRCWGMPRLWGG